jgi:peptidyl-tRNA hydrolase, PTH1 family
LAAGSEGASVANGIAEPWLVAGLGNPGDRFATTRHNVGWMVADALCVKLHTRRRKVRFVPLEAAEVKADGTPLLIVTTSAFMNLSGPPIASFARKRGVPVERVIVVHDELDLPFGALKLKQGGSTAGHNGLGSLVQAFRSPNFFRVRIGIGRPPGRQDPADFVLEPFATRQRDEVEILVEEAADAVLALVTDGLRVAQDRFNRGAARD